MISIFDLKQNTESVVGNKNNRIRTKLMFVNLVTINNVSVWNAALTGGRWHTTDCRFVPFDQMIRSVQIITLSSFKISKVHLFYENKSLKRSRIVIGRALFESARQNYYHRITIAPLRPPTVLFNNVESLCVHEVTRITLVDIYRVLNFFVSKKEHISFPTRLSATLTIDLPLGTVKLSVCENRLVRTLQEDKEDKDFCEFGIAQIYCNGFAIVIESET